MNLYKQLNDKGDVRMSKHPLDALYERLTVSINSIREDLRYAHSQRVFDKDNTKLTAYIAEREAKLNELRTKRATYYMRPYQKKKHRFTPWHISMASFYV